MTPTPRSPLAAGFAAALRHRRLAVVLWLSPGALGGFIAPLVITLLTCRERQKAEQALAANQPKDVLEYDTSDGR